MLSVESFNFLISSIFIVIAVLIFRVYRRGVFHNRHTIRPINGSTVQTYDGYKKFIHKLDVTRFVRAFSFLLYAEEGFWKNIHSKFHNDNNVLLKAQVDELLKERENGNAFNFFGLENLSQIRRIGNTAEVDESRILTYFFIDKHSDIFFIDLNIFIRFLKNCTDIEKGQLLEDMVSKINEHNSFFLFIGGFEVSEPTNNVMEIKFNISSLLDCIQNFELKCTTLINEGHRIGKPPYPKANQQLSILGKLGSLDTTNNNLSLNPLLIF